ncbi:Toluene-4-sulfonate monooxygenase system iron-sulfur subunit TsaM1 [Halioglobus japonicus]|nr:Toluene-4-sulfonate monooxygenase system iron-sulfur subunit TsaM1 [Halioglobus japonicus]
MAERFDHRNCWYPIAFSRDIATQSITPFSVYDDDFILLRDTDDNLTCLRDKCPHRAARLSTGKLGEGVIECQYHGWQFDLQGQCVKIPQLEADKEIPQRACVESFNVVVVQGLVWFWYGDRELSTIRDIPTVPDIEKGDTYTVDYIVDLPYDQSYLIENVIDVAHIHIAHHGIRGGGNRELARPIDFTIEESSAHGIKAQFKSIGLGDTTNSPLKAARVQFVAPNLIHYTSEYKNAGLHSGLALYSLPLGQQRCRLLYRKYSNFFSKKERRKPRWLEHHTQNTILQQDMAIIIGQHQTVEKSGLELNALWHPVKTSDQLVLAYRRWLDEYGGNLPFYRGYRSSRQPRHPKEATYPDDAYQIHTRHCSDCKKIYARALTLQKSFAWALVVMTLFALYLQSIPLKNASLLIIVLFIGAILGLARFRRLFE